MSVIVRLVSSFAALVSALGLLLADSAEPICEVVPFDRTYRVVSSCPQFGEETIQVRLDTGDNDTLWPAELSHLDGDETVVEVSLEGRCADEGDPVEYTQLHLSLAQPGAPTGSGTLDCFAPLDGSPVTCSSTDPALDGTCTVTIDPVRGG